MAWCDNTGESLALLLRKAALAPTRCAITSTCWMIPSSASRPGIAAPADHPGRCRRLPWRSPTRGAQLSLFEQIDGWRYQLGATNGPAKTTHFLEARHRPHARVEDDIRTGKQTGTRSFALSLNRDQPGLVRSRHHRHRPAGLATPALPGRSAGQSRTQDPALPAAAHRHPHRARPAQTQDPHPETWPCAPYLAACPHAALAMPHRPDAQSASSHPQPPKGSTRTRGTRRPPEARVGTPAQRITGDCVIAGVCVRCLLRNALATPGVISAA
jgi:hypothetical protein